MSKDLFANRREAGIQLSKKLDKYKDNSVVYALPRGGVEIATEIALKLHSPINLIISRKIGHPSNPEYAIGAVTEKGPVIWNQAEKPHLNPTWRRQAAAQERQEARRRHSAYLSGRQESSVKDRPAIFVDDGIATGLTMLAAISEVRKRSPSKLVIAVPVASVEAMNLLANQVDEAIVLVNPIRFLGAVGAHYADFPQLNDRDVRDLLDKVENPI